MDYEKAYNEMVQRARELHEGGNALTKLQMEIVCPELAESEDERIRKEIRNFLVDMECKGEWIAYLEKHKDCCGKTLIRDSGESACSYMERCLTPEMRKVWYEACAEIKEKQKEQKQSEMEKEYVRTLHSLIADFLRGKQEIDREYYQKIWDWLDNRHIDQKPAEWSEEDEKFRMICSECVGYHYSDGLIKKETYEKVTKWLKSLRPQPKEELAKMLQDEYNKGKEAGEREGYTKGYDKGYKDANESLSYHFPVMPTTPSGFGCDGTHCTNPHMDCINCPIKTTGGMFNTASSSGNLTLKADWKPSEEQMEALQIAATISKTDFNTLTSLLIDLKKL